MKSEVSQVAWAKPIMNAKKFGGGTILFQETRPPPKKENKKQLFLNIKSAEKQIPP